MMLGIEGNKRILNFICFLFLFTACKTDKIQKVLDIHDESLFSFSSLLGEKDTLCIRINSSICATHSFGVHYFFIENNNVVLHSKLSNLDGEVSELKTAYVQNTKGNDSLSFESFFKYLSERNNVSSVSDSPFAQVIFRGDTLGFYTVLHEKMEVLEYYVYILRHVYPEENLYEPLPPPREGL